uniref:Uncharacterized protein n=1 Tax=Amphimedon queenslandica TaxID=400682 RepID=A0A1X7TVZ7_AMPQE
HYTTLICSEILSRF